MRDLCVNPDSSSSISSLAESLDAQLLDSVGVAPAAFSPGPVNVGSAGGSVANGQITGVVLSSGLSAVHPCLDEGSDHHGMQGKQRGLVAQSMVHKNEG